MNQWRALFATALAMLVLACAPSEGSPDGGTAAGTGSVLVTTDIKVGEDGLVYIEGAKPEVRLSTVNGEPVATLSGGRMEFQDLRPGTYRLEPALRPCDGMSCTDPRTDSCERAVQLTGGGDTTRAHVEFRVGKPCTVILTEDE